MTVPNNVLRFEVLLYLSLLLDALTAAFFGIAPDDRDRTGIAGRESVHCALHRGACFPGLARGAAAKELGVLDRLWIFRAVGRPVHRRPSAR